MKKDLRISLIGIILIAIIFGFAYWLSKTPEAENIYFKQTKVSEETPLYEVKTTVPMMELIEATPKFTYTPIKMMTTSTTKTYMDYRAITAKNSAQYRIIHSDRIEICKDGFLRDEDGFIGVAMGSYFGSVGERYICYLDNGKEIKVIKVEEKANQHTNNGFCGSANNDIIEFVIDTKADWMRKNRSGNGYIFSGNFNHYSEFNGKIVRIDKVVENNS